VLWLYVTLGTIVARATTRISQMNYLFQIS
jgi:hypothetical protein